ncbi:phage terminase small subunit [Paenibacillus rubinfantis]|uniref:phage terminase small subunit n=1 Tax=Paenibacillus rubinfantis TaxID=1720296 RepID=UPI00073E21B7|nr:phage terminase small subunit [Paenibacillus rubinfantis]
MPRARDPNRDRAMEIWLEHGGDITNRQIAELLDVDEKKVAVWKQRDNWNVVQQSSENVVQQTKPNVVQQRYGAPKGNKNAVGNRGGAPPGNKNAVGNRGGPGGPFKNDHAVTHGFFRKFLPERTLEIMEQIAERSPIDMLWDQIMIQYTAIISAQQIMFVESKNEMIKELKKSKYEIVDTSTEDRNSFEQVVTEEEYEFQFSWDRHATFLTAQTRAMAELRSSIKQFIELANEDDERRLKLEQMQLNIEKTKVEVEKASAEADKLKKDSAGKEPLHIVVDYGDDSEEDDAS